MFHRLLIPLDGSRRGEESLPLARAVAEMLGAEIILFHVVERRAPQKVHGEAHLTDRESAANYLDSLCRGMPSEVRVRRHVHVEKGGARDVGKSIAEHAGEYGVDLIVMSVHGAGGLRHELFGTVAQRVISLGPVPLLLAPPSTGQSAPELPCRRVLVPLDGDPSHEQGLAALSGLGPSCAKELLLVLAVPTWRHVKQHNAVVSRLLPATSRKLLELSPETARSYLRRKVRELEDGEHSVEARVVSGEPASEVVKAAATFQAGLIVLATHGRTHLDAFWSESLTPRILRQSKIPLLLVPVKRSP